MADWTRGLAVMSFIQTRVVLSTTPLSSVLALSILYAILYNRKAMIVFGASNATMYMACEQKLACFGVDIFIE